VAERPAEGAAVAHLSIADERHGARKQRQSLGHHARPFERGIARERTDADAFGHELDAIEAGHPVEVDDGGWPQQAHVQQRDEALAAGEAARVAVVPAECGDRGVNGVDSHVLEGRRLHRAAAPPRYPARAVSPCSSVAAGSSATTAPVASTYARLDADSARRALCSTITIVVRATQLPQLTVELVHDDGRQAGRQLVDQQQLRRRHERAPDGQHGCSPPAPRSP
jgi:hypothetical protein